MHKTNHIMGHNVCVTVRMSGRCYRIHDLVKHLVKHVHTSCQIRYVLFSVGYIAYHPHRNMHTISWE